jgi:hypothetical protein
VNPLGCQPESQRGTRISVTDGLGLRDKLASCCKPLLFLRGLSLDERHARCDQSGQERLVGDPKDHRVVLGVGSSSR